MAGTRFWIGASTLGTLGRPAAGIRPFDVFEDGSTRLGDPVDVGPNPQFLAPVPGTRGIVVVHELERGTMSGWRLDGDAAHPIGRPVVTGGDSCHVAVAPDASTAYVANYGSGTVTAHVLSTAGPGPADPSVQYRGHGPVESRQASSHAHQVVVDGSAGELLTVDLGGDAVHVHALDTLAVRRTIYVHSGAGPRHLALARGTSRRTAIVACELDRTAAVLDIEAGVEIGAFPASEGDDPNGLGLSAIRMTAAGTVLIGDRSSDSLRALRFDQEARTLELVADLPTGGRHPRDLELTTDERYAVVADQASNSLAVIALDADGLPERVVDVVETPSPSCVMRLA